jgi:hypothetical protein
VAGSGNSALISLLDQDPVSQNVALRYEAGVTSHVNPAEHDFTHPTFASITSFGGVQALAIGGETTLELFDASSYGPLAQLTAAVHHDLNHEIGYGMRPRTYFLLDLDGDGDDDFVERSSSSTRAELWLRVRRSATDFDAAIELSAGDVTSRFVESPFLRTGVMPGRLFASDRSTASGTPAAVWPLICGSGGT